MVSCCDCHSHGLSLFDRSLGKSRSIHFQISIHQLTPGPFNREQAPYALLTEAFLEQKAKKDCPACDGAGAVSRAEYNAAMNSDSSIDFDHIPIIGRIRRHRRKRAAASSASKPASSPPPASSDYDHDSTCPEHPNYDPFDSDRPFQRPHSLSSRLLDDSELSDPASSLSGLSTTIVTLHNLSMLLPQALIALLAAAAFKFVNERFDAEELGGETERDTDEIVRLFRATGVLALIGSLITRFIGETRWEKSVRKKLNVRRWI